MTPVFGRKDWKGKNWKGKNYFIAWSYERAGQNFCLVRSTCRKMKYLKGVESVSGFHTDL